MFSRRSQLLLLIALALSISALTLFWLTPPPFEEGPVQAALTTPPKPDPSARATPTTPLLVPPAPAVEPLPPNVQVSQEPRHAAPVESKPKSQPPPQAPLERVVEDPPLVEDLDAGYEGFGGLLQEVAPLEAEEAANDVEDDPLERQD